MSERDELLEILNNEANYTYVDWAPELDAKKAAAALVSYVMLVKAYAFNEGYNAATDAHGITT